MLKPASTANRWPSAPYPRSLASMVSAVFMIACQGAGDAPPQASVAAAADESAARGAFQALSFGGDSLFASPGSRALEVQTPLLNEARAALESDEGTPENWIWVGRRLGYLQELQEAITIFTQGAERFPEDPRFLRHRGHRYLSTRNTEAAIADFRAALDLAEGTENTIEPDGLPNDRGIPQSSLHRNIWYHLAVTHFVRGEYEQSLEAWHGALQTGTSDDSRIASTYWTYLTLTRLGRRDEATELLESITPDLDVVSNQAYLEMLLLFKGELALEDIVPSTGEGPKGATTLYGLINWHHLNDAQSEALRLRSELLANQSQWGAFGYIAAEADAMREGV